MTRQALLAGIVGGVAMYAWASIAHLVLPISRAGITEIPNEQPVLTALHATLGESSGLYMYPALGTAPGAMQQYGKKLAVSPSGLLIYHPPGAAEIEPRQLITEFLAEMVEAVLAIFLLAYTGIKTIGGRVGFVTMTGFLASIVTNVSYWNWYGFPTSYTAAAIFMQVVGFAAAGAAAAFLLKNRAMSDFQAAR